MGRPPARRRGRAAALGAARHPGALRRLPVSVAGWTDRWRYAWPRDVSFVSAALARAGHLEQAARQLGFFQRVQRADGWFEARYDRPAAVARRPSLPARRDGVGAWAAAQIAARTPTARPSSSSRSGRCSCGAPAASSPPLDAHDAARALVGLLGAHRAHPDPGTAAAVLAGMRSVGEVLPLVGEMAMADRARAASDVLALQVRPQFGPAGYPRLLGGEAADAAVAFLVPPIGGTTADIEVLSALDRAQTSMMRPPAGSLPGRSGRTTGSAGPRRPPCSPPRGPQRATGAGLRSCSAGSGPTAPRRGRSPRRSSGTGAPRPWRRWRGRPRSSSSPGTSRSCPGEGLAATRAAVLVAVGAVVLAPAALATTPSRDVAPTPVVVVGAPGLAWSDLDRDDLPALSSLIEEGALGSLTVRAVRSRACAVDGWLTLSSGRRAADLAGECRVPAPPGDGVVPGWSGYVTAAAWTGTGPDPGARGGGRVDGGVCRDRRGGRRDRRGRRAGTRRAAPGQRADGLLVRRRPRRRRCPPRGGPRAGSRRRPARRGGRDGAPGRRGAGRGRRGRR